MPKDKYEMVAQFYYESPELLVEGWYNTAPCNTDEGKIDLPDVDAGTTARNAVEKAFIAKYCQNCPISIAQSCFIDALQHDVDSAQVRGGQPAKELKKYADAYNRIAN